MGVMGKEGRQAVNNSDFAIGQFRCGCCCCLPHVCCSATRGLMLATAALHSVARHCDTAVWQCSGS